MAHLKDYTWGSNGIKNRQGLMYTDFIHYNINQSKNQIAITAAEGYIHYIHGVNPLNLVYLSNMYDFGAENSVNEFYHSWFTNGSAKWDRVGTSTYGPAPGFLTGGPNPEYDWHKCCPSGCGSTNNNSKCFDEDISPPKNQPKQKSYKDFNNSWPLNSWSVTENSCGYQLPYIRLLAHFLPAKYDCSGVLNGTASYDVCGICSGGNTGIEPTTNVDDCIPVSTETIKLSTPVIFPNPAQNELFVQYNSKETYQLVILNTAGQKVINRKASGNCMLDIQNLKAGSYFIVITSKNQNWKEQFIKR
jgi:hypothetical protein